MSLSARSTAPSTLPRQRGATLLIGLIMLALLTVHALAAFTTGSAQLRIAGNSQARQEVLAAGNVAIGSVLGSGQFLRDPLAVSSAPLDVDVDGDGVDDYRVVVVATCSSARPVLARDLDPAQPEDVQCLSGTAFGSAALCVDSAWNLQAIAAPAAAAAATGATVEINQGAIVRLGAGDARSAC
ncbi:MAG: hypothetical protein ABI831_25975 [Betaproteobacteria bacterium]